MADYVEILDTQIEPDAPLTSILGSQFRDNPIAIAEGSVDAPKVVSEALNLTADFGSATTVGTTGAVALTVTDLDRVATLMVFLNWFTQQGTTGLIRYRTSTDNGSSWSTYTTVGNADGGSSATGLFAGNVRTIGVSGSINAIEFGGARSTGTGTITINAAVLGIAGVTP